MQIKFAVTTARMQNSPPGEVRPPELVALSDGLAAAAAPSTPSRGPAKTPPAVICVDLDGTLVTTDTLLELLIAAIRQRVWIVLECVFWLFRGKAGFKAELAGRATLETELLPYNRPLLAYLQRQKEAGRKLVLATGSPRRVAEAVAARVGLFEDVIASDRDVNLAGEVKAQRLVERFGAGGFAYAGNDAKDLAVWRQAGSAIVVAASAATRRRVPVPIEVSFPRPANPWLTLLEGMRIYQWVKNLLVFVPVITANALTDLQTIADSLAAFLCFGLIASGLYLLNDLFDLDADRRHERKRQRPFASGRLPLHWGFVAGPALVLLSLSASLLLPKGLTLALLIYAALSLAYSAALKTLPLIDAFTLGALFTLRVVAGGEATDHRVSIWLLSFSGFVFLSLAFLKRYVEVSQHLGDPAGIPRRGYHWDDGPLLIAIGLASSFASAIVLSLYVKSGIARDLYASPQLLWGLVPIMLYWQCRLWLAASRHQVCDDPIVFAFRDRLSWLVAGLTFICYALASQVVIRL